jgi:hypothetical protein
MKRPLLVLIVTAVSAIGAWYGQPYAHGNSDLFVAIITLFAVFGGFLVAVMSIGGDVLLAKTDASWGVLEVGRKSALGGLNRARLLFYVYLLAAFFILVAMVLEKVPHSKYVDLITKWTEFTSLWFTCMGVIFSFALPTMLIGIQQAKIDSAIERGRGAATAGN